MSAVDKHNRLARDFVHQVAAETSTQSEMMVVIESAILACMLVLHKRNGMSPSNAVEMVEEAIHQATHRFAAIGRQEGK